MVPTKVPRPEMAGSQRPSDDRSVPPPRWRKTQTRREAYDCRSRYTSWKKSRQHRRSPDRTGKASLGAIDPRNILILQVESSMTQYGCRAMPRQFTYRGHSVDELKQMSMDEFIKLLPSRQRRSLLKGLTNEQRILMEHVRQSRKENASKPVPVKSHVRDMIVIPEMLGLTLQLHSGKEYVAIDIKPEMIGHFVGEFAITNQKVVHGTPGIGASRSSMYVPLK